MRSRQRMRHDTGAGRITGRSEPASDRRLHRSPSASPSASCSRTGSADIEAQHADAEHRSRRARACRGPSPGPTSSTSDAARRRSWRRLPASTSSGSRSSRSATALTSTSTCRRTGRDYVKGALELGKLKATDGAFGYALPPGTDPADFASALIWCKQFSHLFAVAPLEPA